MAAGVLLAALAGIVERLAADDADGDQVVRVLDAVQAAAARVSGGERVALLAAVDDVEQALTAALARLEAQLAREGNRRNALAGYGALRPHTSSQQLRTRV